MVRLVLVLVALAGVAEAARPAEKAHRTRRYVLRDVRIEGNATPEEKKLLQERIWSVVELLVGEGMDELAHVEETMTALATMPDLKDCMEPRCGVALGDALKADKVLSIGIERSGAAGKGDWMVRVWHFDVRAMKVGAAVDLPCNNCNAEDLLGDLSHSLGPALKLEGGAMCTVKVTSRPEGATVSLDNSEVGYTPFQHTLLPGKHNISVEAKGYARGEDQLECQPGSMQNMAFGLTEGGGVVKQEIVEKRSPALKIVGAGLIVLGVAGVAAGAAELYLDGRGTCNLGNGQTQCKEVYDTSLAGGVLVGVGAAAIVGGVVTLVVDGLRDRPSKLKADIGIGASSVMLGLRGSF